MNRNIILATCLTMLLSSCILDTNYDAADFTGKVLPRITGYTTGVTNDWIYFNMTTDSIYNKTAPNQEITEGQQLTRTDWDFAFCGHHVRTNGGTSGPGKGAAADLGYGDYKKWTSAAQIPKDTKWVIDNDTSVNVTISQNEWYSYLAKQGLDADQYPWFDPNSGPQQKRSSANPLLEQSIAVSGPPMSYAPSYHTYVIRSADGKHYYKLQIVSWYNTKTEIGGDGGQISYYLDKLK
ncbi:HmuY family protein [Prevotella cerevisiae]|uniref:HmuY family protein n=1 Tax=Segatella cerevisiae TaxID=2053716 RepID=A0ABT1BUN0_9BACT|nr:HmuY family protein [Segatella cerevisiae]MCO6024395.1 HmuY family protein [Segatella cerevisiae]